MRLCLTALLVLISTTPSALSAYEKSHITCGSVSSLESGDSEFSLGHKFFGELGKEREDFLGLENGAFVSFSYRHYIWNHFELLTSYTVMSREYAAGAHYSKKVSDLRAAFFTGLFYFSYEDQDFSERRKNFFYWGGLQTDHFFNRLTLTLTIGYDGYNNCLGVSTASAVTLFKNMDLIGEYLFKGVYNGNNSDNLRPENSYLAGVKITTWGHHFIFYAGNSFDPGLRRAMLGAYNSDLSFGFRLDRKF